MSAIETDGLTKRCGDMDALAGLSLSVGDCELFALLGPNGSGKTTTIEILTGQRTPTGGSARVLGMNPVEAPLFALFGGSLMIVTFPLIVAALVSSRYPTMATAVAVAVAILGGIAGLVLARRAGPRWDEQLVR